ncbi:MAG: amino acid--tRNA ligase-related protein [Spirochaetota bacterium]
MLSEDVARFRAATIKALRAFFDERGYLEVDTPVLAPELIPEAHIEVFETRLVDPFAADGAAPSPERAAPSRFGAAPPGSGAARRFLVPSPEIWMKRLLAQGYGNMYSLGKVFRNAESTSRMHHPEFTMLEWYTVDADYRDQALLTGELLRYLGDALPEADGRDAIRADVETMTVAESIARYAGMRLDFAGRGAMREAASALGLRVGMNETEEDLYQRILLTFVEPRLPHDHPVILTDYPAMVPTLARRNGAVAERWELYLQGMEIANCYTEERDRARLEEFLRVEGERKQNAVVPHSVADSLLDFASAPPCSGVALGVDRLVMALLDLREIGGVIFFP